MKRVIFLLLVFSGVLNTSCKKQNPKEGEEDRWAAIKADLGEKAFIGVAFLDNKISYVDRVVKMNNIVGGSNSILQGGPTFINYQEVLPGKISYSFNNINGEFYIRNGETYTLFINSNSIEVTKDNYLSDYVEMNTLRWFYAEDKVNLNKYKLELNIDNEWIPFDFGKIHQIKHHFNDRTTFKGIRIYMNDSQRKLVQEYTSEELGQDLSLFRKDITFELREFPNDEIKVRLIPLDHFYYSGSIDNRIKYF